MTDDDMTQEFGTTDADDVADRGQEREEYRSLMKISPTNEAKHCETIDDCQDKIDAELEREEPRSWVVAIFNERKEEIRNNN